MNAPRRSDRWPFVLLGLIAWCVPAQAGDAPKAAGETPWGTPVDGLACRLTVKPRYVAGQSLTAIFELKNISDKTRYIAAPLHSPILENFTVEVRGPTGTIVGQTRSIKSGVAIDRFQPIRPGEVKRLDILELFELLNQLENPHRDDAQKTQDGPTANYIFRLRFRSPVVLRRFQIGQRQVNGKIEMIYQDTPKEMLAGQWSHEISTAPAAFEYAELTRDDFIVHEWGVFTTFNDVKYANVNRREEWGKLPDFFYRQFPQLRLRWVPSAWDKPLIYFYAKPTPLRVKVQVTFAEGAPVVWWPAAADPVDDWPGGLIAKRPKPFRSLTWLGYLGDEVPVNSAIGWGGIRQAKDGRPLGKVTEFPLPADCWLQHARLPDATRLTVVGNVSGPPQRRIPGALDRPETERFIYYDGLVPAPDYLRCETINDTSLTLHNHAAFPLRPLFIVDRHVKASTRFWADDPGQPSFGAGTTKKFEPKPIAAADWPAAGIKPVRQALLDAGLFAPEVDSLLKIWRQQLFEAEGVTVFHILPAAEYDRMLPLSTQPTPVSRPVRVGVALHPHVEIEPALSKRVAALIRDLGDTKFEPRNAASKTLLEIGPLAVGMLRAELKKDPPLEVRRRIEAVLDRVDAAEWLALQTPAKKTGK